MNCIILLLLQVKKISDAVAKTLQGNFTRL